MELTTTWFVIIAFFWVGYFVLEGFDFGVGMLLPVLGRDDRERRLVLNTIGPIWDGNEVWVIVAGASIFAAFPEWYATLFSGYYLALLLILVALILRVVAIEFRGKRDEELWRKRWDAAIFFGSAVPAVVWGIAFANIVGGSPIDANHEFAGGFFDLLNPYGLLGGLTTLLLFLTHGAVFLALKTSGDMRDRANRAALRVGIVTAFAAVAFITWTLIDAPKTSVMVLGLGAIVAFVGALSAVVRERDGWAFLGTAIAIGLAVIMLFAALFPNVMVSSLNEAWSLTTTNAASTPYTLKIMTWTAVVFTPIVIGYQAWSYWVFRKRLAIHHIPV